MIIEYYNLDENQMCSVEILNDEKLMLESGIFRINPLSKYCIPGFNPDFNRLTMSIFVDYFNKPNFKLKSDIDLNYEYHCLLIQVFRLASFFDVEELKKQCLLQIGDFIKYLVFNKHESRATIEQFLGYRFLLGRKEFITYCHNKDMCRLLSDFIARREELECIIDRKIDDFESVDSLNICCKCNQLVLTDYLISNIDDVRLWMKQTEDFIFDSELPIDIHNTKEEIEIKKLRFKFHHDKMTLLVKSDMKLLSIQNQINIKNSFISAICDTSGTNDISDTGNVYDESSDNKKLHN
jgi:hypothetical protein